MPLSLKDTRFTTRRAGDGLSLHPRLLRDRSVLPRIDIAIQYFESMRGRPRREFDAEVLSHFFGDQRLTRAMVACLARSYRFRSPRLDEVLGVASLQQLQQAQVDSPVALRLHLYDQLNDFGFGFLQAAQRDDTLASVERGLGLGPAELEPLLALDALENAVLVRFGPEPRPADVAAEFNLATLLALLAQAEVAELELADWPASASALGGELALASTVELEPLSGPPSRVHLYGRADALGSWTRHGRRLARVVAQLLERVGTAAVGGQALVTLPGRQARLRLTAELLELLAGPPAPAAGWGDLPGWQPLDVAAALATLRRPPGWSLRRQPEPRAHAGGLLVPDLLVRRGDQELLIVVIRSAGQAARLSVVLASHPDPASLRFVGPPAALGPLREAGWPIVAAEQLDSAALLQAVGELPARRPLARGA